MTSGMRFAVFGVATSMVLGGTVLAHDGHSHTLMGTVAKVSATQLEVKTKDGTLERVVTTEKTTVTRGKSTVELTDIVIGDRVVIDVGTGKAPVTARSIKLGTGTASAVTVSRLGAKTKTGKAADPPAKREHNEH
jgi:hypothetical protein